LLSFLDELRQSWRPEHSSEGSWTEERSDIGPTDTVGGAQQAELDLVAGTLIQSSTEPEAQIGDLIRYCDILRGEDVLAVTIVRGRNDLATGTISSATPLAQCLLGSVVGDEVVLRVPGSNPKTFRILEILKPK
jgi:transcription elongation GreA/GreB family factor